MRLVLAALAATACADFRDCTEVDTSGVAALPVALLQGWIRARGGR